MSRDEGTDYDKAATTLTRRTLLGSAGVLTGLAGCTSGGDGDGDDSRSTDDETPTETAAATETENPTTTMSETATATEPTTPAATTSNSSESGELTSEVSELTIVSAEQDISKEDEPMDPSPAGIWIAHLQVRNTGDQETDVFEYDYEGGLYDTDENEIGRIDGKTAGYAADAPPGETGSIIVQSQEVEPDNVESFGVTVSCGTFSDGVYCDNA